MKRKSLTQCLRTDVEELALPGGRPVGSAGHARARAQLLTRMIELGLEPYREGRLDLEYEVDGQEFCNLVGVIPGSDRQASAMLIGAHYDTCGAQPGADDNAAAVAIALRSVPFLRERSLKRDVIIAIYDSEEPPWFMTDQMGSRHFYNHQRRGELHFSLVMDLVGHDLPMPGFEDMLFVTGMESDPCLERVFKSLRPGGIRVVPTLTSYIGDLSDYHSARLDQRPYLFLSCGHWEHYHEESDTPDKLNYDKIASILDLVVDTLALADVELMVGPFEGYETTATEIAFLTRAFEPVLEQLNLPLQRRCDVDEFVRFLLSSGL